MKRITLPASLLCLVGSAAAWVPAPVEARMEAQETRAQRVDDVKQADEGKTEKPFHTQSELLGHDVVTVKGADRGNPVDLAKISDIAFDPRTGNITYALLMNEARETRAVEWSTLLWSLDKDANTIISIDVSEAEFKAMPPLSEKDIAALVGGQAVLDASGNLERKAQGGAAKRGDGARAKAQAATSMSTHLVTKIDDIDVYAKDARASMCKLGDYVVDCAKGRVAFATMAKDGSNYMVPIEKVAIRPAKVAGEDGEGADQKGADPAQTKDAEISAYLAMTAEEMAAAPKIAGETTTSISNPRFRSQVYDFYGVKPDKKRGGAVRRGGR